MRYVESTGTLMNTAYDTFWKRFLASKGLVGRNSNDFSLSFTRK